MAKIALNGTDAGKMWIKGQLTTGPSAGDPFCLTNDAGAPVLSISGAGDLRLPATDRLQTGSDFSLFGMDVAYDGWRALEQYENGGDTPRRQFVYGSYLDEPLAMDVNANADASCIGAGDQRYFYHQSLNYSVLGLTDAAGHLVEAYEYTPYGEHITLTPAEGDTQVRFNGTDTASVNEGSPLKNPFMYTGKRFDPETKFYYYNKRVYDPYQGKFLSSDPIGYINGPNQYEYVHDNPLDRTDPYGLAVYVIQRTLEIFNNGKAKAAIDLLNSMPGDMPGQIASLLDYYSQRTRHCIIVVNDNTCIEGLKGRSYRNKKIHELTKSNIQDWYDVNFTADYNNAGVNIPASDWANRKLDENYNDPYEIIEIDGGSKYDQAVKNSANSLNKSGLAFDMGGNNRYNCCDWASAVLKASGLSYENPNPKPFGPKKPWKLDIASIYYGDIVGQVTGAMDSPIFEFIEFVLDSSAVLSK